MWMIDDSPVTPSSATSSSPRPEPSVSATWSFSSSRSVSEGNNEVQASFATASPLESCMSSDASSSDEYSTGRHRQLRRRPTSGDDDADWLQASSTTVAVHPPHAAVMMMDCAVPPSVSNRSIDTESRRLDPASS